MSTAARLFKSLLDLARRPMPTPGAASQSQYAMWLERDCPCGIGGCGVWAAAGDEWDWLDANLYRQRGGPR